ncbi:MAG: hypothetical protein IPO27_05045 [Bacteroidetes bacterium]|nr:hypothetical protein [Bacteroidota bacterium]
MTEPIIKGLINKGSTALDVFASTKSAFELIKAELLKLEQSLKAAINASDPRLQVVFEDRGHLEIHFKVANEVLIFIMHPSVLTFDHSHPILKLNYTKKDPLLAFCGMIYVYNFSADTFKFNREQDLGLLVARIFVNKEKHFFMEGKKQIGLLYNRFDTDVVSEEKVNSMLQDILQYCIDIDPQAMPYDSMIQTTLLEIKTRTSTNIETGKRFGFMMHTSKDSIK